MRTITTPLVSVMAQWDETGIMWIVTADGVRPLIDPSCLERDQQTFFPFREAYCFSVCQFLQSEGDTFFTQMLAAPPSLRNSWAGGNMMGSSRRTCSTP